MNDNPIRVTIDSVRFADPSLKVRVAAILEKALKEEFEKTPPQVRENCAVEIKVEGEDYEQMLHTTRHFLNEMPDVVDVRPLTVEIIVE